MRARIVLGIFVVLVGAVAHVGSAEARTGIQPAIADDLWPGYPHLPPMDPNPWVLQLIRHLRRYWHPWNAGLPEDPPAYRPARAYTPNMHRGKLELLPAEPRCDSVRKTR